MNRLLEIRGLTKSYESPRVKIKVLAEIDFSVNQGEFICILGPSGCGKTTLLRVLAGLENQTEGSVSIRGVEVKGPSQQRAMVFQESRLFPWLTVEDNIAIGLSKGIAAFDRKKRVQGCLELIGLADFAKAYPHELSGGMAQRVALARALVINPEILLLDEPFSALDAITRMRLQDEVQNLWRMTGTTMIMVTHDIDEAIRLGQRVIMMSSAPGKIVQEFSRVNNGLNSLEHEDKVQLKLQIMECLNL